MAKKKQTIKIAMIFLIIIVLIASLLLTLNGALTQQTQTSPNIGTQGEEAPLLFQHHFVNITVYDERIKPLKNVWVVLFENNVAELYGYTDENGSITFQAFTDDYVIQFEKYHYIAASQSVTVGEDTNVTQTLQMEEAQIFGIPSWAITLIIGLILLGLTFWNSKSLKIEGWGVPENWFGKSRDGSWTFLDKSTKTILYGITGVLLVILVAFVVPNFPTFHDMSFYYIIIGIIVLAGLLIEGKSNKSWIAAIGFGKTEKLLGNILIGLAFAFVFIGITGFYSQLSAFAIPIGSLVSIFMIVIVASFFEEGFWSGLLAPTIAEKTGIVSSIFFTSVFFMGAHGLTYGWAVIPLVSAFFFRFFATIIVLHQKSWMGIFFAHVVINVISLFSIMIFS